MKRLFFIITLSIFVLSTEKSFAQLTKDEIKAIKKEIKSLSPEQYVQMKDDLESAENDVVDLKSTNSSLEDQVGDLQSENAQLRSDVADYKAAAEAAIQEKQEQATPVAGDAGGDYDSYQKSGSAQGIVFKVQIGAFKNFDIRKYFNNHKNFSGEVDSDGTMKYTLGVFGDYWEADKFKKYLREMGVKGAWIVSYKDGKRVNIKDALEGAI